MADLEIHQIDSVYLKVDCDKSTAKELSDFFTFSVPNHKYTPAYKNKMWDGQIRLFNVHTRKIYAGLLDYIVSFAKERKYSYEANIHNENKLDIDVEQFINEVVQPTIDGEKIQLYDYQMSAVKHAFNKDRCLLLSPTGSGKSLIIYSLIRLYDKIIKNDKKILIIVPTTNLVLQLKNDFINYSSEDWDWDIEKKCHLIYAGRSKETNKRVVISTWQSIYKEPKEFFDKFNVVFGDECHLFKAKSLTSLMTNLTECPYRIGTTGTLDGTNAHKLVIEGLFGTVSKITTTKQLMEDKILSELSIDCINLKYSDEEINETKRMKYQDEIKWLISNQNRNGFISNLSCNLKGNTLLLFNYVDSHGKPLYEMITKNCSDKEVFFISGGTDVEQREQIRNIIDKQKNSILVASYGTCSTGINIKNINNIIFASPSKSVIRVLQSIGRGLRKSKIKQKVKLYDISDDLRYKKYRNHTFNHMLERIKIYNRENFNFKAVNVNI